MVHDPGSIQSDTVAEPVILVHISVVGLMGNNMHVWEGVEVKSCERVDRCLLFGRDSSSDGIFGAAVTECAVGGV